MEYVYAALLLDAAGKEITEHHLMEVVKAAGMSPDEARAKAIVTSLKDVNIKEVIKNAQAAPVAAAPAAGVPAQGAAAKKEEKKEEQKNEAEAAGGLASLFG